jgi:hypothetical protein
VNRAAAALIAARAACRSNATTGLVWMVMVVSSGWYESTFGCRRRGIISPDAEIGAVWGRKSAWRRRQSTRFR